MAQQRSHTPFEQTLGRYRLIRVLGQGGVGTVHLGVVPGNDGFEKFVAIKVLKAELTLDPVQARALQDEAHLGADLEHQNIVQILDLGVEAELHYMVMEYIRGFSLAKVLSFLVARDVKLPIGVALHLFRCVSRAIEYVHRQPGDPDRACLFHGDISASNVLVGGSGRVALGDFGVAALLHANPNQLAGKWSYVPPEALIGARVNYTWDLYALSALLYELLTGSKAFPCDSFASRSQVAAEYVPAIEKRPDLSQAMSDLVGRFLDESPDLRPNSAKQLRREVDEVHPPSGADEDSHVAYFHGLFAEGSFVDAHGELPSTTSVVGGSGFAENTPTMTVQHVRVAKPLRFGLTLAHGPDRAKGYGEQLSELLATPLERPLRPVLLGDYHTLLDCLLRGDVDIAWMPPMIMAEAASRGAGLISVMERDGKQGYSACLFTQKDSSVQSLKDLGGKSVAWVERESASGYHYPRHMIADELGDPDKVLGRSSFHGSHSAVCEAVANGWTDVGATYIVAKTDGSVASCAWEELLPDRADELRVVAVSRLIPGDCIAYRPHFSEHWLGRIRSVFLRLHQSPSGQQVMKQIFHADRFVVGEIDDYEGLSD